MKTGKHGFSSAISAFMLERYRLGELSTEDKKVVEAVLESNNELCARLRELEESDRELRLRYPASFFRLENTKLTSPGGIPVLQRRFVRNKALVAAAVVLCLVLPVFYFLRNDSPPAADSLERIKGKVLTGSELFIFVKESQETALPNQTVLEEGNTVQLAYTTPAGVERYGVIFSVDGRSVVTMHYPYRRWQSSILVSGKRTFLNEAYILDDAPDYEVFVFLVSAQPLDVQTVLHKARLMAEEAESAEMISEISKSIFEDCEIETVTLLKRSNVTQMERE